MPGRASTRCALHMKRCAEHDGYVDTPLGAGLEQYRDLEHGELRALFSSRSGNRSRPSTTMGCTMLSSCLQASWARRRSLLQAASCPLCPPASRREIPPSIGRNCLALIETMHAGIGVEHGHAAAREMRGSSRLAHADPAGQSNDEHHCRPERGRHMRPQLRRHLGAARRTSARSLAPLGAEACQDRRHGGSPARPGGGKELGFERAIDDVGDDGVRRQPAKIDLERLLVQSCRGSWCSRAACSLPARRSVAANPPLRPLAQKLRPTPRLAPGSDWRAVSSTHQPRSGRAAPPARRLPRQAPPPGAAPPSSRTPVHSDWS